jgi:carbon-monoxide dehydrogenase medium subunit
MKPPRLSYARPESLGDALSLAARYGADAKLLAGGQSLVPMLNLRLADPGILIDLNRLSSLSGIRRENGSLRIGALTRHRELELSPEAAAAEPLLKRAAREIGHLAIRNRGTIGGSIAHADPSAEWPLLAVALDAKLGLRSQRKSRTVPARDFFAGPFTTCAEPDEILTEIDFPLATSGGGFGFQELCRRPGDFAIVAVACRLDVEDGRCTAARIAVGGAGPTPLHLPAVEAIVKGSRGENDAINEAAAAASRAVDPASDLHGSADYRRRMVAVLTRRALSEAFTNASPS